MATLISMSRTIEVLSVLAVAGPAGVLVWVVTTDGNPGSSRMMAPKLAAVAVGVPWCSYLLTLVHIELGGWHAATWATLGIQVAIAVAVTGVWVFRSPEPRERLFQWGAGPLAWAAFAATKKCSLVVGVVGIVVWGGAVLDWALADAVRVGVSRSVAFAAFGPWAASLMIAIVGPRKTVE